MQYRGRAISVQDEGRSWLSFAHRALSSFPDSEDMSCLCALSRQVAGAGAVSWLCAWWRQGAGCRCWCCELAVHVVESGDMVPVLAAGCLVPVVETPVLGAGRACGGQGAGCRCRVPHSSYSVLADSCVKGCTVCAHTFARFMFYAQRQALNRPLLQDVSACYTHNSRAGYRLALGEWSVRALPFARVCINLYAQDHTALSFYRSLLQACYKFNSGAGYCLALGQ